MAPTSNITTQQNPSRKRKRKAQAHLVTLYDAVAGRAGYEGFLKPAAQSSKYRDTASTSTVSIPPEEVLFRQKRAPERYEEDDIYCADRHLDLSKQLLPRSDLLKAVHAYTADFYGRNGDAERDFRSLDETALLAVGILLEEAASFAVSRSHIFHEANTASR